MANYETSANVVLTLNGKQAGNMMSSLERKAETLRKKIDQAASAGDKATMQKLQRELRSTNRIMEQLTGSAFKVDDVLRRLDSATPKELNKALRQLKRELNGLERGTEAWDAHVRQIKAVRAELDKVNGSLRESQSLWQRFNGWLNNCQTALLGVAAGFTGLTMAGRKAVDMYASMDQEMANVRKFTGLSAEQVEALNEEFKKMDTRTSREELNQLAQQAGRLGKQTPEEIMGFVRAANQVNVALDDLGEDATLTLSKLTGVFGDEKRLGTEKALLSVGSVINELSQNCAASAPYLAEFASRMGGVASQAGMTAQQVMAFGAVLDSNNQPLEASATALSQVLVRLYQEPAKYAQVAGLDVRKFTELVRSDMNAALIELLSTLQQSGGMENLAPMFADMDENGSRAVAALSTLAGHIEEVKDQQEVANRAFEEATSITQEYDVQNNTVQAGIEKAKKRVTEIAVELGQKLMPVVRLVSSSMTIFMKVLSTTVDFVSKYKGEIIVAVTTITAYKVAVTLTNNAQRLHNAGVKAATVIQTAYTTALNLGKAAMFALSGNLVKAGRAFKAFSLAIKANPIGMLIGGITALVGVLQTLASKYNDNVKKMREQREESEKLKRECTDFASRATEAYSSEILKLQTLYNAATNEANSRQRRIQAARELQKMYPDIFAKYSAEEIMVRKAAKAYNDLAASIMKKAEAQAAADLYKDNFKKILQLKVSISQAEEEEKHEKNTLRDIEKRNEKRRSDTKKNEQASSMVGALVMNQTGGAGGTSLDERGNMESTSESRRKIKQKQEEIKKLRKEKEVYDDANEIILGQFKENKNFQKQFLAEDNSGAGNTSTSSSSSGYVSQKALKKQQSEEEKERRKRLAEQRRKDAEERRAAIKEKKEFKGGLDSAKGDWERDQAENETEMTSGLKGWSDYLKKKYELQQKYYDDCIKLYEEAGLSEDEDYQALLKKKAEHHTKWLEEKAKAEEEEYKRKQFMEEADAKADFHTPWSKLYRDEEALQKKLYEIKVKYLKLTRDIHNKTSKEYHDYNVKIEQTEAEEKQRRMALIDKKSKERDDELAKIKAEEFGLNKTEREAAYVAELNKLNSVYAKELAAAKGNAAEKLRVEKAYLEALKKLREEYAQDTEKTGGFKEAIGKTKKWLDSEGGQALIGSINTIVSGMSSTFSQLTSSIQADLEMQTAAIDSRYDKEISRAEGNSYKVAQLEKKKQAEIAEAKNEANRKMFAMQVIQAVAQTAQNAISAYGSAAAIPLVGHTLAPIAASMAVAAGMLQVAAIKKQAQASEAQGYAEGGFTRDGRKDEPVGIVHAGEWVAPKSMVESPVTRPLINALEQARLSNTVPAISAGDVSRRITAPIRLATAMERVAPVSPAVTQVYNTPASDKELGRTIRRLADRLDRPFVTVNAVTGDDGMHKAQRDYERLISNKSPRRRNKNRNI